MAEVGVALPKTADLCVPQVPFWTRWAATVSLSHAFLCWYLCPRNQTQLGSNISISRNLYKLLCCDCAAAIKALPHRFVHGGAHLSVLRQTCYKRESRDASLDTFGVLWCVLAGGTRRSKAGGLISITLKSVPPVSKFFLWEKKMKGTSAWRTKRGDFWNYA